MSESGSFPACLLLIFPYFYFYQIVGLSDLPVTLGKIGNIEDNHGEGEQIQRLGPPILRALFDEPRFAAPVSAIFEPSIMLILQKVLGMVIAAVDKGIL